MKYTVKARPYCGKDYTVRVYDTLEQARAYVKRDGCTVPCDYGRAGLVIFENDRMFECYTTPHTMETLNW